jgi:DNA modification methylase
MPEIKCAHDEMVEVGKLVPNPKNPNKHPKKQIEMLAGIIEAQGWRAPITVSNRSGFIVRGHCRLEAALLKGWPDVPVDRQDYASEAEEWADMIADNKIAELAETDEDMLLEVLKELDPASLQLCGIEDVERMVKGEPDDAPEPQIDRAEELMEKWKTERGQIWEIGKHRLMCGDSTKDEDVASLMFGKVSEMIWTDPPYGVSYGDKLDASNPMGYKVRSIQNDDLTPEKLEQLIRSSLCLSANYSIKGASIYMACPPGTLLPILISAFSGSGFVFHWGLVWVKDQLVLGRGDYHFKHENILYGWKSDGPHYFTSDRTQTSVFEVNRPKSSVEHPTMKPPELISKMLINSSHLESIIYDPFLGSGATMVAAEQLGRICYGMEIEPKYVAVVLERMSDMGLEPKLVKK